MSPTRRRDAEENDMYDCKWLQVVNIGKAASRFNVPQVKMTTIKVKGYFGFIVILGGTYKVL